MAGAASSSTDPSGVQGVCPDGWHLPSNTEWTTLTDFLGGAAVAGGKLKETGTNHWDSPNAGASNQTGFTAIAGGARSGFSFYNKGLANYLWSATESSSSNAWYRSMGNNSALLSQGAVSKDAGFSVRCLRD